MSQNIVRSDSRPPSPPRGMSEGPASMPFSSLSAHYGQELHVHPMLGSLVRLPSLSVQLLGRPCMQLQAKRRDDLEDRIEIGAPLA